MGKNGKKSAELDEDVHRRLQIYGYWGETISDVIDRALDEAGAPRPEEVEA